jgi:hypothetical protein
MGPGGKAAGAWSGRGVKLTTHFQLVPRSRKCGSIHPLPIRPHGTVLNSLCSGTTSLSLGVIWIFVLIDRKVSVSYKNCVSDTSGFVFIYPIICHLLVNTASLHNPRNSLWRNEGRKRIPHRVRQALCCSYSLFRMQFLQNCFIFSNLITILSCWHKWWNLL